MGAPEQFVFERVHSWGLRFLFLKLMDSFGAGNKILRGHDLAWTKVAVKPTLAGRPRLGYKMLVRSLSTIGASSWSWCNVIFLASWGLVFHVK
jgi:hypothetical protein